MTASDHTTPLRRCAKCGVEFPATTEYFYRVSTRQRKDGLASWCKTCHCLGTKQSREKHADKVRERQKRYRETHRPEFRERSKRYCQNHPDRRKESQRRWSQANPEKEREKKRRYRANNPERVRAEIQRRRAWKVNAEGSYTDTDIKAQYERQKGKCYWCGCKLSGKYHVDHIVPLSRGGSNRPENLVCACEHCNDSKGAKLPHEWTKGGHLL